MGLNSCHSWGVLTLNPYRKLFQHDTCVWWSTSRSQYMCFDTLASELKMTFVCYVIWYMVLLFQRLSTSVFMVLSQQVFQKHWYPFTKLHSIMECSMAQVLGYNSLTVEAWVQSQARQWMKYNWEFSPSTLFFLVIILPVLYVHISFIYHWCYIFLAVDAL